MNVRELFEICEELARSKPSLSGLRRMHEVLTLCCSEGTRHQGGRFGNLFSQVDYLCKQYKLSTSDRVAVQTLRRHTRENSEASLTDEADWRYDLRALVLFVSASFKSDVPGSLRTLLPSRNRELSRDFHVDRRYVRCIVERWDEQTITVSTDEGELTVDYGSTEGGRELTYLKKMLREGMQLNLLDSHVVEDSGMLVPRLIVVEPDFLIDISSIAACFTNYGHHPLLYTVNRLKERANSQAILLGNFAGAALDDIIANESTEPVPPKTQLDDSLRRSFREQALHFCTCEDFDAELFKQDALNQVKNLQATVRELFENESFDRGKALLEPSFVCERLGLQGRVDLMTSDLQLLVEQKSGRNMKIEHESHDPHGLQREDHYVQLLLYYGILRYNFGRSDQSVDIRLLYSRYPVGSGLLSVNYYRQLFAEAIRLRNQIVATELLMAREGYGRVIPLLSPAVIYKDVKADRYFHQYILPELQDLQRQLATLQPVERAYYERMMTFVYREEVCQKLGTADQWLQHSSGSSADLWQQSLAEKLEAGSIYHDLTVSRYQRSTPYGGYDLITLDAAAAAEDVKNFRRGDMIYLYAYRENDHEPDVRDSILYKGSLEMISVGQLVVRLSNGQQNEEIFQPREGQRWAIEHAGSDITTSANLRSLHQFITSRPTDYARSKKALLLGQRAPEADASRRLSRSYSKSYDALLERSLQARDYFLIVGPPGTGKTSQALRFIIDEELTTTPEASILLTAYTNRAVDEICNMLTGEGHAYLRIGNEQSCDPRFKSHLLESALTSINKLSDIRRFIASSPIIVGTTSTLLSRQDLFLLKHFTLAIVDEASQILEPNIIGLLANEHIDRFILVGDHKQLPAVVQQDERLTQVTDPCLLDIGLTDCRHSLFERLLRWERRCGRTQFIGTLDHQGRMHPEVAQFPCEHFYVSEQLLPVPLDHQLEKALDYPTAAADALDRLLQERRVLFLDVPLALDTSDKDDGHEQPTAAAALSERREARLVATLMQRIHRFYGEAFRPDTTMGVIVPYRHQIGLIRQELEPWGIDDLLKVSIDTVERYQGSQRDVIIYSFAVSHHYQLDFLTANTFLEDGLPIDRKLNVAMTRARRQLIMTGRADLLQRNPLFREIIEQYGTRVPL